MLDNPIDHYMVRDMDLIREILLYAEKYCNGEDYRPVIRKKFLDTKYHSVGRLKLYEHIRLAKEHGLIEVTGSSGGYHFRRLTWNGHDFLDNSRSPEVWNAAKKVAGGMSFTVFCNVLTQLATERGTELLKSGYSALTAAMGS